jgi:inner membrane protein
MASIGHIFVGMAAGRVYARNETTRMMAAWMIRLTALSLLPDLDAISFVLGIPYGAPWGHRGATHSPAFALLVAVAFAGIFAATGWRGRKLFWVFACAFLVTASHGILDALTDGGRGVEFGWPLLTKRYFFPWHPLPVAPIGPQLFAAEGREVMLTETLFLSPLLVYALVPWGAIRARFFAHD